MSDVHAFELFRRHLGYLARNPQIVPKLIRNYYRLLVLKEPVLRKVEFALTYACGGRCAHCSTELLRNRDRRELDADSVIKAVRECVAIGAVDIHFTGGEALLRKDFDEILRRTKDLGVIASVATNGKPLTAENVLRLKKTGVSFVSVSIDSAEASKHDAFRGLPGCFDALMAGTRRCLEAGIDVFLCTVVTRENIADGDAMRILQIAEGLGVPLTLVLPCRVGRWKDMENVLLNEKELAVYRRLLRHPSARWEGNSNYLRPGCPAGTEKIYITPFGDILPCNFAHVSFGNVLEESVETAWRRMHSSAPIMRYFDDCKAGSDKEFMKEFMSPTDSADSLPMPFRDHPTNPDL